MNPKLRSIELSEDAHEASLNAALAGELEKRNPRWRGRVVAERSGVFAGNPALRPDIVVFDNIPIVVETEYAPGRTVEADARARLGNLFASIDAVAEQVIAVCFPPEFDVQKTEFPNVAADIDLSYCVVSGEPAAPARWPRYAPR